MLGVKKQVCKNAFRKHCESQCLGLPFLHFRSKKARSNSNHNENFMPFSLFKMLKNRWDQVKIPASEIRFSKTFRFVAQVDAFLVIFHFWATIRLCFTTRIAWRFPEAESSLGVMEYHRFSIFEIAKNFQGNCNHFVIFSTNSQGTKYHF